MLLEIIHDFAYTRIWIQFIVGGDPVMEIDMRDWHCKRHMVTDSGHLHEEASIRIECSFDEFGKEFTKHTAAIYASFFETNVIDHLHSKSGT